MNRQGMRLGLLASIGTTLDAFFLPIVERWREQGLGVFPAAGTEANHLSSTALHGITRKPHIRNVVGPLSIAKWVTRYELDALITNTATASALARISPVSAPVIYFCHGLHWDSGELASLPTRCIERVLVPRTAGVITINSTDDRWFEENAPGLPRLRLRYGVGLDVDRFSRREHPTVTEKLDLLWIGEFSERKDPFAALKVAGELASMGRFGSLTMLGLGPLRVRVERAARDANLNVDFPGRTDPVPHLRKTNVVIHTASWEGLPRVLLEAVAMGVPIAAFSVKGVSDIPTAALVRKGDYRRLAESAISVAARRTSEAVEPKLLSYRHCADTVAEFAAAVAGRDLEAGELWVR